MTRPDMIRSASREIFSHRQTAMLHRNYVIDFMFRQRHSF